MLNLVVVISLIISGCVFGSTTTISEKIIKGKKNIIFNSGFENGEFAEKNMPENWQTLSENSNYVFWDDINSNSGEKSLRIENPKNNVNIVSEPFPINPKFSYYTKFYSKTNFYSMHQIYIYLIVFDEKGKRVNKFREKMYPKEKWTKGTLIAESFNNKARFGRIIISIPKIDEKTFWIDDIESFEVKKIKKIGLK